MDEVFETRWYWVDVWDVEPSEEPDFSRVPEARRDEVVARWRERQMKRRPKRCRMWGPQIPMYRSSPAYRTMPFVVIGPVADVPEPEHEGGGAGHGDEEDGEMNSDDGGLPALQSALAAVARETLRELVNPDHDPAVVERLDARAAELRARIRDRTPPAADDWHSSRRAS